MTTFLRIASEASAGWARSLEHCSGRRSGGAVEFDSSQVHPRFVPTQQIANNQRINIAVGNLRKQGSINYDDGVPASPANSNVQFADQNRNVNNSFQIQQMQNPFAAHNQV
jgi:hypothetical protein